MGHRCLYIDTALHFGLRSAPKIFSGVTDALLWFLHCKGVRWQIHYLNDLLFLGPPNEPVCAQALKTALDTCQELGVSVAFNKVEGPSPQLTFLSIQIDACANELSLPPLKLARISSSVKAWLSHKAATKRELQSLIGLLSHCGSPRTHVPLPAD